jgi:hypothetical protein
MPSGPDQPVWFWVTYRLRLPLALLFALVAVSTIGYEVIEGYGWVDALYMTVITPGTIGYGEVHELGTDGRLFTIGVIVASFATLLYAASVLTNMFTSGITSSSSGSAGLGTRWSGRCTRAAANASCWT